MAGIVTILDLLGSYYSHYNDDDLSLVCVAAIRFENMTIVKQYGLRT